MFQQNLFYKILIWIRIWAGVVAVSIPWIHDTHEWFLTINHLHHFQISTLKESISITQSHSIQNIRFINSSLSVSFPFQCSPIEHWALLSIQPSCVNYFYYYAHKWWSYTKINGILKTTENRKHDEFRCDSWHIHTKNINGNCTPIEMDLVLIEFVFRMKNLAKNHFFRFIVKMRK